jgi:hypothetical protein
VLGWKPEPLDSAPTSLVKRARTLLETPIADLGAADVGFLLRQKIGVEILLDRALDLLEVDPLVETEYYPGDLLCAVLRLPPQHFAVDDARGARVAAIADKGCAAAVTAPERPHISEQIRAEIKRAVGQLNASLASDKSN